MTASTAHTIPEITFSGVEKRFAHGATALAGIDLTIQRGEFISLLGPSGCGKSTMLRLIAGLTHPSAGTITVNGITPAAARELVSFIFQDATLLPWRTVRSNIGLGLEVEHVTRDRREEIVDKLLRLVHLEHVARHYPRQLSGGMKMRVSIARALATRPSILLLDEPFAALDEMTRDQLNEDLLRLHAEQSWTTVFVTHSVAEAVFLSSRIAILAPHPGRVAHVIENDLAYPRNPSMRGSPAFEQQATRVSRLLREVHGR
jgi:NitT/TauT family transport system ATP-binding protein